VYLPGTDHIEDLHEHKGIENESQVARWAQFIVHILRVEIIPIPVRGAAGEDETRVFGVLVLCFGFRNNELASK
jgi:primosomal replication protein N